VAFDSYDHTKALELAEKFFWTFTDDYLELVKERAYNAEGTISASQQASAAIALRKALHVMLRLFAPFLPFATEEVWGWWQKNAGSIHRASWPVADELTDGIDAGNAGLLDLASIALGGVRKAKSDAKASMKAAVDSATIEAPASVLNSLRGFESDLKSVGKIQNLSYAEGPEVAMTQIVLTEFAEN
jgi:valyl-tRNA synthetase